MICKMKRNISLRGTVEYNERKIEKNNSEKVTYLGAKNVPSGNSEEIKQLMLLTQKSYTGRARQVTYHAIISPHVSEASKMTDPVCNKIYDRFLAKMKLDQLQSMAYVHRDREHTHIHIIGNRVTENGELFNYAPPINDRTLANNTGRAIAKELGFMTCRPGFNAEHALIANMTAKIKKDLLACKDRAIVNQKFDRVRYIKEVARLGHEIKEFKNGYLIRPSGEKKFFKSSDFNLSWSDMEKKPLALLSDAEKKQITELAQRTYAQLVKEKNYSREKLLVEIEKTLPVKRHFHPETKALRGYSIKGVSIYEINRDLTFNALEKGTIFAPSVSPSVPKNSASFSDAEKKHITRLAESAYAQLVQEKNYSREKLRIALEKHFPVRRHYHPEIKALRGYSIRGVSIYEINRNLTFSALGKRTIGSPSKSPKPKKTTSPVIHLPFRKISARDLDSTHDDLNQSDNR